jgi:hypothetical protein
MKLKSFTILLSIIVILFVSCNKDCSSNDNIHGYWEWTKSIGGFYGRTITPKTTGFTSHIFISGNQYKEYQNDSLIFESTYELQTKLNSANEKRKYIFFESGWDYEINLDCNELILYEIHWSDGYTRYYSRKY